MMIHHEMERRSKGTLNKHFLSFTILLLVIIITTTAGAAATTTIIIIVTSTLHNVAAVFVLQSNLSGKEKIKNARRKTI